MQTMLACVNSVIELHFCVLFVRWFFEGGCVYISACMYILKATDDLYTLYYRLWLVHTSVLVFLGSLSGNQASLPG